MIVTEAIKKAIKKAIESSGSAYQFSLKMNGIAHTTIANWVSGKSKSISDPNWEKLEPLLRPYLKKQAEPFFHNGKLTDAENIADDIIDDHLHNQENWGADVAELDREILSLWKKIKAELKNEDYCIDFIDHAVDELRKSITERTARINDKFSDIYADLTEKAAPFQGELRDEKRRLLEHLYNPSNNLKRYEILAEIEREKIKQ